MKENKKVRIVLLPPMSYSAAWDYQTSVHKNLITNKINKERVGEGQQLILAEHHPVYTLGRSGSISNLLLSEDELEANKIEFFPINRGGDITYHGPGQITGYPILDLECFYRDVHLYVRNLEEVMINVLGDYGIKGGRIPGYTGVWIEENPFYPKDKEDFNLKRKICAIGVHLSRWVTLHGWAFNVNTDLSYYKNIIPCGIEDADKTVTSLANELGCSLSMKEVMDKTCHYFSEVFEVELIS